ncbi:2-isopropylmalate synthase [Brevibacillus invocatus]|uniref:2-isopropylmalate synthase n=1 Tax=Brevibacillus invocatus TaxID=173959 RepID=A0A3M8C7G3_9BACL|nr:2-isopropylmalate synthase [Brevibacillus invocatus]MCM3078234.1 2-isopropylmalate synthase [Brevibacillus invocatus]MCM3428181.1 2-isopropylmalate synthase [Brevibacillus invocatus]RNB71588.1 2-isopropylmalate synthase [Brevibacillus invocatus]
MRTIEIFDTTLRDGEQSPGVNISTNEKVEIALQLEKLGVTRIEAGFAAASPGDQKSVAEVAKRVKNATIVSLARAVKDDMDKAYEALRNAENASLHVFLATSPIHREFKLNMSKEQVLQRAVEAVTYAKKYFKEVQFSAEDAARTEIDFLKQVVEAVIKAGATTVNIPDTVGYMTPIEYGNIFRELKQVPGADMIRLSCHCHDDLGMAVANSLAAIEGGATQVEGTINGIGERAGNAALEEVALALETRKDYYQATTKMNLKEIARTSQLVSRLTGMIVPGNKAIVGANAFAHESGIHQDGVLKNVTTYEIIRPESVGFKSNKLVLGKHSGRHAFKEKLIELGYHLEQEEVNAAFAAFKVLCDKKKEISDDDILALVDAKMERGPEAFQLESVQLAYGNISVPTASVRLLRADGSICEEAACGNGSVDSIYKAIDRATGEEVTLTDYKILSVTHGKDALGEVYVRLQQGELSVTGRGVSTDVLEASAIAYIRAVNKILERRSESMPVAVN